MVLIENKLYEYLNNMHGNRTNMLSFFAPYSLSQKFGHFTENIGGEVANFALSGHFPDVYQMLCTIGCPKTVHFLFSPNDLVQHKREPLAIEIIRQCASKMIVDYNYNIVFEGALTESVPPEMVLELINYYERDAEEL